MTIHRRSKRQTGAATVLAIVLLAMFAALAAAFAGVTGLNARMSGNTADSQQARLAAESGLSFAVQLIRGVQLPSGTEDADAIPLLGPVIASGVNGTANLGGATVLYDDTRVLIPRVQTDDGAFDITITRGGDGDLVLQVIGVAEIARCGLTVKLVLNASPSHTAFDYGIASMGPVVLGGNAEIRGKNALTEASVISVTDESIAISLDGHPIVDGDLSSVGADTSVVINGAPTVAGSQDPNVIAEHVHFGVEAPIFPEIDTTCFRDLAVNVIDSSSNTSQNNAVYDNIVIKAGTNPTFASDVVLNGVVYVEAPNNVSFAGKVTLNGVLATDDTDQPIQNCKVNFAGQVEAFGVDALPNEPQFEAVKQLTGTFIAAPGFDVSFAGQFTTINGTVAADKLTFSGQAEGTVEGSVIGLAAHAVSISGQVSICIDRSGDNSDDAGFKLPVVLDVDSRTYTEIRVTE